MKKIKYLMPILAVASMSTAVIPAVSCGTSKYKVTFVDAEGVSFTNDTFEKGKDFETVLTLNDKTMKLDPVVTIGERKLSISEYNFNEETGKLVVFGRFITSSAMKIACRPIVVKPTIAFADTTAEYPGEVKYNTAHDGWVSSTYIDGFEWTNLTPYTNKRNLSFSINDRPNAKCSIVWNEEQTNKFALSIWEENTQFYGGKNDTIELLTFYNGHQIVQETPVKYTISFTPQIYVSSDTAHSEITTLGTYQSVLKNCMMVTPFEGGVTNVVWTEGQPAETIFEDPEIQWVDDNHFDFNIIFKVKQSALTSGDDIFKTHERKITLTHSDGKEEFIDPVEVTVQIQLSKDIHTPVANTKDNAVKYSKADLTAGEGQRVAWSSDSFYLAGYDKSEVVLSSATIFTADGIAQRQILDLYLAQEIEHYQYQFQFGCSTIASFLEVGSTYAMRITATIGGESVVLPNSTSAYWFTVTE